MMLSLLQHQALMNGAGALLFDARCLFDGEEARADEVLRSIATDLPEAVATCAAAAAADHSPARQAALLKARPHHLTGDSCTAQL